MTNYADNQPVIWLQITAGVGPKECGWVVGKVAKRLLHEAEKHAVKSEIIESIAYDKLLRKQDLIVPEEYLSILIRLQGNNVLELANRWLGSVQWQGQSHYRPKHKRINWFVGVQRVDVFESENYDLVDLKRDVEFSTCKSSGAGGQHVNKTDSAVRLFHKKSGIQLRVDANRSQHRNKTIALERLQIMLAEQRSEKAGNSVRDRRLKHYQVDRGNPIRKFKGLEFAEF